MRCAWLIGCVLVSTVMMVAMIGCGDDSLHAEAVPHPVNAEKPPEIIGDAPLTLVWAAQGGARLEPCGCSAGMHGGLARRATIVQRLAHDRSVRLELGGWSGGRAQYQVVRAQHYLRGLTAAGIDVIGLGAAEVQLGSVALAQLPDARVVCANLVGQPSIPASVRVVRGGRTLVLTSVVAEGLSGPGLTSSDPLPVLHQIVADAAGAAVVVMADLDAAGLERLARAVPGLSAVIGGAVHDPSPTPLRVGTTWVMWAANMGKTVGWWPWGSSTCAFTLADEQVADDPGVRAQISAYQLAVGALGIADDPRFAGLTELNVSTSTYVGDQSCAACHAGPATVHAGSRHAHSLAILTTKGYDQDPECLRCHVTGLERRDGYRRAQRPAEYDHVTCESCHGPRSDHVMARRAGRPGPDLPPVTPATCQRCHDPENSPRFDYVTYWTRIHHE